MAPRKSTARASSATPVRGATPSKRSTRASSALEADDAIPRRVTRGASSQPIHINGEVNNPRLPEVQIQQSYAYGSSKTPVLPTQLIARSRMNLREMAETIDAGVNQAEQQLQEHNEETRAHLQKDTRADRARRRASREPSQEGSVDGDDVEPNRTQRVAVWASSVDNPQLDDISEEEQDAHQFEEEQEDEEEEVPRSTPDDVSNKGTDPSSFPSGVFDHSYNYERGLRKPNVTIRRPQEPFIRKASNAISQQARRTQERLSQVASSISAWSRRLFQAVGVAIQELPNSSLIPIMTTFFFALLLLGGFGTFFCYTYSNYICDPLSPSTVSQTLQRYCGACTRTATTSPLNFTVGAGDDLSKLTSAINNINNQLRTLETRIDEKVSTQYASVDKDLGTLKKQHSELSNHVANLGHHGKAGSSSGDVASPVMSKVNYFAPNNGAIIEPRLTSPTMQKPLAFMQRVFLRVLLSTRYVTKSPITALSPWHDVGDCWCASSSVATAGAEIVDTLRLGVKVIEPIYPTELVVENYPSGGSLLPNSAPYIVELWADFEHLDSREWEALGIRQMQGPQESPLGPTYALIGRAEYDVSAEASHVQAFPLDVNQDSAALAYAARNFVVRVPENYGAEYTCLYRVRLHGVPVIEH